VDDVCGRRLVPATLAGMHVQIKPGLRLVWRGPTVLQIGLDPRHGVLLDGLAPGDRPVLTALTGGLDLDDRTLGHREHELVRLLAGAGVLIARRAGRARLRQLGPHRERLVPDAAAWSVLDNEGSDGWERLAGRARRTVQVIGSGRTGAALATTLAAAGVGRVLVLDPAPAGPGDISPAGTHPGDAHLSRQEAARRAIRRVLGPAPEESPDAEAPSALDRADLVVRVEPDVADAGATLDLLAADVPHLSVVVREAGVVVGPMVLPGQSACLRCLDLHRAQRDPGWPRILAQLLARRTPPSVPCGLSGSSVPSVTAEEVAIAQLAASLATLQVLGVLDRGDLVPSAGAETHPRRPAAVSATLEVDLPDGLISRREWPVHPRCGCVALPGQNARRSTAGATMTS